MSNDITATPTGLSFQIPTTGAELAPVAPPAPMSPAVSFMGSLAGSATTRKQLICKDLLDPASLELAKKQAEQLLPQMLGNTELFLAFGSDAVEEMNRLFDSMLKEVEPTDAPELKALMKKLNDRMRETKANYDPSDPKVREQFEKWSKGVRGFFRRGKTMIEMLMEDMRSIEGNLDKVADAVNEKERQMIRNISIYDQLYEQNEKEILKVVAAIAVMELIGELAAQQAADINVDPQDPQQRAESERKRVLAEFANNMEIRIAEFKNRLFVAWTTSPQVTNMRTLDVGLATKLRTLTMLVIPTMKGQLLQWRTMLQSLEGADMEQAIAASANEWILGYSQAAAAAVPMIASAVHQPTLAVQTVNGVATAIQQQADGIIAALNNGERQRAEVDNAIVQAHQVVQAANQQVSDAIVDQLVAKTAVPAAIDSSATELPSEPQLTTTPSA